MCAVKIHNPSLTTCHKLRPYCRLMWLIGQIPIHRFDTPAVNSGTEGVWYLGLTLYPWSDFMDHDPWDTPRHPCPFSLLVHDKPLKNHQPSPCQAVLVAQEGLTQYLAGVFNIMVDQCRLAIVNCPYVNVCMES